ncbi:MAG TPA: hypothetical protein VKZ87_07460 [Ferrovibrio sp.]|uniref:hypothetical protein n=1 Tax=Ferrovibrio sp. TaxID=1917215 RepID=UPI002B4B8EC7|nr:hypothetical protein [Ferrovibrio sp.]HLT77209.1 hypothetical protein [Ferrovibrio sp.]
MIKTLLGLVVGSIQTASLAQKLRQYAIAAALGLIALASLVAAFLLGGWAMFLGFGQILNPAWAAAASAGILLAITAGLLLAAVSVATKRVPDPMTDAVRNALPMGRQITREHPIGAVAGAVVAGVVLASMLRSRR